MTRMNTDKSIVDPAHSLLHPSNPCNPWSIWSGLAALCSFAILFSVSIGVHLRFLLLCLRTRTNRMRGSQHALLNLRLNALAVGIALALLWPGALAAAPVLKWESGNGFRRAQLNVPASGKPGFTLLSGETTGIQWTNRISVERYTERQNLMNGAGLALGDFDSDGWCDIYLCNKEGPNALYRNLGNWKFENVTERAGVSCTNQSSTGATFADLNGDGRLDLLVTSFTGPNACFLNLGEGRFTNVTAAAGLLSKGGTTSMALGDIDGDGDLDLYVCSFGIEAILRDGGAYSTRMVDGRPVVTGRYAKRLAIVNGRIIEFGEPDILFRNDGQGKFTPLDWREFFRDEKGQPMMPPPDFGLAVQVRDINGDGAPDIYVCNDFQTPDRMWLNDGRGRFRAVEPLALRNMSYASMGADFADFDRDGRLDFIAVEMLSREHTRHMNQSSPMTPLPRVPGSIFDREEVARNTLCWNRGDGTYAEIAWFSGVAASDWSWTPIFLDVDLDGYEDLLITNGHMHDVNDRDVMAARKPATTGRALERRILLTYPKLDTPKAAFRNRRDLTFEDVSDAWGFNSRSISHGLALADLDNDGDLDAVANCVNEPPLVYRNDSPAPRVAVRLKGRAPNTQGIGARVTLRGAPVVQTQEILCGGRYLAGDDPVRAFAVGSITNRLWLEVTWRDGRRSVVQDVRPNGLYEVSEGDSSERLSGGASERDVGPKSNAPRSTLHAPTLFEDVSHLLGHTHLELPFDDFARQPLLPKKLSQLGPGVAWYDLNADGHDELIVGAAKAGNVAVFLNDGKGALIPWSLSALNRPLPDDGAAVLGWTAGVGQRSLLVALASYESANTNSPAALRYDFAQGALNEGPSVAATGSSAGALAVADIDSDGDLDLFVGSRFLSGRYPEPASSRLFRNENGQLAFDSENSRALERIGLVSGAVFTDLNGDGWPDLALACEWGSIRIFLNERGNLKPFNPSVTLHASRSTLHDLTGLWTSVTAGDFDGDGRMDLVAGNWGMNTFYRRTDTGPWHLYYGEFNQDGQVQMIEAYPNDALKRIVPFRDLGLFGTALPWLRERFPTHKGYARAGITEILGDRMAKAKEWVAVELRSMVFLNRGASFEAKPLPSEAQWTPAMGLNVADLDGDGHEDLFLSQNFFAVRAEDHRQDAGRGLLLKGDGKGNLTPVPVQDSGIKVYGEQRGSAAGDYDADGRVDLVVTQNAGQSKLYRNASAKPGLRVRLRGAKDNPDGIGATVRLMFGERFSPAHEIRAGSGYWSQDSAVPIMATPEPPSKIWIRWPGGKIVTSEIPKGAGEIVVDSGGSVEASKR
ncbi:MAG: hypothetical protein FJ398_13875 [Verrucomicrobia bacterium]|nr:hypothetical protein [Verrucomicrobiota bacterium]